MSRPRKVIKAKEPVKIRERKLANGNVSLYLDIYTKGFRKTETLGLYLVPVKTPLDQQQNEHARQVAERVKAERILGLQNAKGAKGYEKIKMASMSLLQWLDHYANDNEFISKSTARGRRDLRQRVELFLQECNRLTVGLTSVDEDLCRDFLAYLRTAKKLRRKKKEGVVSNGNALHLQTLFTGALNKAVRDGLIPYNPMQRLESREKFHYDPAPRDFLTIDEVKRAIAAPSDHEPTKQAFLFSCFTGLRLSDVKALTMNKIQRLPDDSGYFVRVRMQKTNRWLDVPLSAEAMRWLPKSDDPDAPLFRLYQSPNLEIHINSWLKEAGLTKHVTFHCARHTFATMMITLGVDLYTVSELLGHSKIETTQIYARLIDQRKYDAMNKLNQLFDDESDDSATAIG